MSTFIIIHSINRWLASLSALALVIMLFAGWLQKKPFDKKTAILTSAFTGFMDLQMLLGLILLVLNMTIKGSVEQDDIEHATTMFLAVIAAHLTGLWKKKEDSIRTRNTLFAVLASIILILLGVGRLGMDKWIHITGLF
ncbi:MAG: hypothetical protein WCP19_04895 [Chloroflexota bacterium]